VLYLWAPMTSGIAHWRTSYRFSSEVDGMIGMSVDMYQPVYHQFNTQGTNCFGSLKLMTTPNKLTSRKPAVNFAVAFKTKVQVQLLINLITSEQRHYYLFHPDGSGCLFWQLSLLQRFEEHGWVETGTTTSAATVIQDFRSKSSASAATIPWPPRQGTYYPPPMVSKKFYLCNASC
jgi:hypothetical protein